MGRKSGTSCYVRARLVGLCLNLDESTWLPALGRQSGAGCAPIPILPDGYPLRIPAGTGCLPGSYSGLSPFVYAVEADSLATVVVSFANLTVELRSSADPYSVGLALTQATMDLGTSPDAPFRGAISAWVAFSGSGAMLIALLLCIYTRWCDALVAKRQGIVATVTSRSRMLRQREQLMQHPLLRDISVAEGFAVPPPMPPTSFAPAPPPNQLPLLGAEGSAAELELGEVAAAGTGGGAIPIRDQEWIRILERAPPPPGVPLSVWEGIGPGDREVMLADDLRRAQGWGSLGWAGREGAGGRGRCVCRVPLCFAFLTSSVLSWVEFQQSTFRGCCPRLPGMDRAQMIILGSLTTLASTVISMVLLALFLGSDRGSTVSAASNSGLWICAYSAVCGSGLSRVACSSFQQAALMSLVPEMPPLRGLMLAACILPLCSLVLLAVSVPLLKDRVRRGVLLAGALLFTSGVLSHWAAHAYMYLADVADAASVAYCNLPMNTNAVQCNIMDEQTDLFAASTGVSVVAVALLWLTVGILLGRT